MIGGGVLRSLSRCFAIFCGIWGSFDAADWLDWIWGWFLRGLKVVDGGSQTGGAAEGGRGRDRGRIRFGVRR